MSAHDRAWRLASLDAVRARIAAEWLDAGQPPERLGEVRLMPHQREAAARLRALMREVGGALLADEVGLGKTYTALATAAPDERLLVVAPASLLAMWRAALAATGRTAERVSFERLSARAPVALATAPSLVIVDEAHHVRTPGTRRRERLLALARGARVLLLSATPIHNRRRDLDALLALFLGEGARMLDDEERLRCIVRRTHADGGDAGAPTPLVRPHVGATRWIAIGDEDDVIDALLDLPPPVPPRDGGGAHALVLLGLVRAWASSHAALRATLRQRLARAEALALALDQGRYPSARELRAWHVGSDALQLAFAELVVDAPVDRSAAPALAAPSPDLVRAHAEGLRRALRALDATPDLDAERAAALRGLRGTHAGERMVAFAQLEPTVVELHRRLARDGGVARLSAAGARVAGGAIARREALRRFAPRAHGAPEPPRAERIDLLLATDLLSEGVSLSDASVVVHVDLPWTPARLEQRVGRAARPGAPRARVHVYAMRPPASAEALLRLEHRLRDKAGVARLVAPLAHVLPAELATVRRARDAPDRALHRAPDHAADRTRDPTRDDGRGGTLDAPPSLPALAEEVRAHVRRWRAAASTASAPSDGPGEAAGSSPDAPVVAAVASGTPGVLAFIRDGDLHLAASIGDTPLATAPGLVCRAARLAFDPRAPSCTAAPERIASALESLERFLAARRAARLVGVDHPAPPVLRRALGRLDALVARAPAHRRPLVASLVDEARELLLGVRAPVAEHRAATLLAHARDDATILERLRELRETAARPAPGDDARGGRSGAMVLALILLEPTPVRR